MEYPNLYPENPVKMLKSCKHIFILNLEHIYLCTCKRNQQIIEIHLNTNNSSLL